MAQWGGGVTVSRDQGRYPEQGGNRWEHSGRFLGREGQSSNFKISKARAAEFFLYCSWWVKRRYHLEQRMIRDVHLQRSGWWWWWTNVPRWEPPEVPYPQWNTKIDCRSTQKDGRETNKKNQEHFKWATLDNHEKCKIWIILPIWRKWDGKRSRVGLNAITRVKVNKCKKYECKCSIR